MSREILKLNGYDFYEIDDTPKKLADKTLSVFFGRPLETSDLPINPYQIMTKSGAYYIILDFDTFEGYFIPPSTNERFSKIALKLNSIPERRRFSAAHELCHHLKDGEMKLIKQGVNDPAEVFANKFATNLLMPLPLVYRVIKELNLTKSDINLDKILKFSIKFAVSFQSAFINLNNIIGWGLNSEEISQKTRKFKPQKKKSNLTLDGKYTNYLFSEIIRDYNFMHFKMPTKTKNDFLKFVVTNDHLIENGKVSRERISEIVSLLRVYPPDRLSKMFNFSVEECEVIGQYLMYDYIFNNVYQSDMEELKNLHKQFCSLASFPEFGGQFRDTVAYIKGASITPTEPDLIEIDLIDLFDKSSSDDDLKGNIKIIKRILSIHHGITVIHPFNDGNGRTSRALMNFQLITHNISPFFISYDKISKGEYYNSLQMCDRNNDFVQLENYVYKNIIEMYSKLIG